jgi:TetR/AcrR family acrAB operon transcriptional repressor
VVRKTKAEAEVTRQTLLRAALRVFSRRGYVAARLEEIASEAGVTRGAIYWHFASKADLYTALIADASARLDQVIAGALAEGGGSFLESTRRVMIRMLAYLEEDETYRATQSLLVLTVGAEGESDPGRSQQVSEAQVKGRELAEIMRAGMAAGQFRADLIPEEAARAMLAYLNGLMLQWLLAPATFSIKASAPALVDIYIRGIAAQP